MMKVELRGDLDKVVMDLMQLRKRGYDVYCEFGKHILYSRDVTLDSAFLEIKGCTYHEFLRKRRQEFRQYREEEKQALAFAKAKYPSWIEWGHKYIPEELWARWEQCVQKRIRDLYHGIEIENSLAIIEAHAEGKSIEEIINLIESQNTSGESYDLIESIITFFYPAGNELFQQITEYKNQSKRLS